MGALPHNKVVGHDWTGPVTQAKCEWEIDITQEIVTVYYRDIWTNGTWRTRVPTITEALGFTIYAVFQKATARQIEPGVLCEVQLTFSLTQGTPTPASTLSENATSEKRSIQVHPNFQAASGAGTPSDPNSPWQQFWNYNTGQFQTTVVPPYAMAAPTYLWGLTEFDVGTSTVTVTDYFTGDPGDVRPYLGMISTPAGESDDGNFLLISGGRNQGQQFWIRRLVYQYSALAWPTQVYARGDI